MEDLSLISARQESLASKSMMVSHHPAMTCRDSDKMIKTPVKVKLDLSSCRLECQLKPENASHTAP